MTRRKVLFVCTGNTCRSVLAQFIANRKYGHMIDAASAGITPGTQSDCQEAIHVLKATLAIDASTHVPRDVLTVDVAKFDFVVTMENHVAQRVRKLCPAFPQERVIKWQVHDPYGDDPSEYLRCAGKIDAKLRALVASNWKP